MRLACLPGKPEDPKKAWLLRLKELQVCYRAEPPCRTSSRKETDKELAIELCFRQVLHKLAIEAGVTVSYTPAGSEDRGKGTMFGHKADTEVKKENMQLGIRVLTPLLCSGPAGPNSVLFQVFERFCFQPQVCAAMLWVSGEEWPQKVLASMPRAKVPAKVLRGKYSIFKSP